MSNASLTGIQRALSASSPPRTGGRSPTGNSKWNPWVMVRTALAAVGVVEYLLALQRTLQHRQRNLQTGFLAQFAQATVQQALLLANETAGQRPQALPGSERRRTSSTWPECTTTASVVTKVGA